MFYALERFIEKKVLPFFCLLLSFLKRKKPLEQEPKSIVIMRFWALGESILVLPMIEALRKARPNARITVLCTPRNAEVFRDQPSIDECKVIWSSSIPLVVLTNFRKFDLSIDTEPHFALSAILSFFLSRRAIGYDYGKRALLYDVNVPYDDKKHAVFAICDLLRPLGIDARPGSLVRLRFPESAKGQVDLRFESAGIRSSKKPIIGIHAFCGPSAAWRVWPKENFASLIGKIKKKYDCTIILTGSKDESIGNSEILAMLSDRNNVLDLSGLPLKSFFNLAERMRLMVSNDTGPMHVAAAQGIPTIGLFGPNTPVRFGPFPPERNIAIYHQQPGHPVINVHLNEFRPCGGECMRAISVDEVMEAVDKIMAKGPMD